MNPLLIFLIFTFQLSIVIDGLQFTGFRSVARQCRSSIIPIPLVPFTIALRGYGLCFSGDLVGGLELSIVLALTPFLCLISSPV